MKKQKYENKDWTHNRELYSRGNWTLTDADSMKIFPKINTSKSKVILPYVSNYYKLLLISLFYFNEIS